MGEISEYLIDKEMFGSDDHRKPKGKYKYKKTAYVHLTPAQKKIASIRKEIAVAVSNGMNIEEARRQANLRYGKGWRERGLIANSDNQWDKKDLLE